MVVGARRRCREAVVEIDGPQVLEAERGPAAVPREEGHSGGEAASRAFSGDAVAVGVDAQFARRHRGPHQGHVAVFQTVGEGILQCEPVLAADHDRVGARGGGVKLLDAAHGEPAAVDVQQAGQQAFPLGGRVEADRDIQRPVGHGEVASTDRDVGFAVVCG
jgi:hypothetical protein